MSFLSGLWWSYRLRLRRKHLLWRALRSRHRLSPVANRTRTIRPGAILAFACLRNEAARLPFFLDHYRRLGVDHFLIVDNDSTDGSRDLLKGQADVSLWRTAASYRAARFGMDWINWLLMRHGRGHWCLTVDADELLIYPDWQTRPLPELTADLDRRGAPFMAAMMLDLYPKGPLSRNRYIPGTDPTTILNWFDADGYHRDPQEKFGNISIRGGARMRHFFADRPELAPHLHKTPLIKWQLRWAYLSSTHIALPRRLNRGFDPALGLPTGVLLHTKFLDQVIEKSREEKHRGEHFTHSDRYDSYYDKVIADPDLWTPSSTRYEGAAQLEALGLMARGSQS
ncbi:MAG: glycosyltransferase family 2 protein [Sphingomonadales bacterium]|nr:glycosyltransferase family 2 protein [Sphingomonadales bacterium]